MPNIIRVTKHNGYNAMVNADQILYWDESDDGGSIIYFVGGWTLAVKEDMYKIVERIEPEPDYYEVSE